MYRSTRSGKKNERKKLSYSKLQGGEASRGQESNPTKKFLLMPRFYPVCQEGNIMDETSLPSAKKWSYLPEDLVISDHPDIPPCQKDYFRKERFSKFNSVLNNNFHHVRARRPIYLQVVPNPSTEIALKNR